MNNELHVDCNKYDSVMISVVIPTYGQEEYIAQALDSVLMQKTKYSMEVLVGEDASPDRTREILKAYEKKYPGFFQMFYRERNMSNAPNGLNNFTDLYYRTRGKYLVVLEGDDFWTDENKLEEQVDFLETHPDYIAVAHNCVVVGRDGRPNGENYPECKDADYTLQHYLHNIFPGQTATVMQRNWWTNNNENYNIDILKKNLSPGDGLRYFALASNGKVRCLQKQMSAYRHITKGGNSFSANSDRWESFERGEIWNHAILEYAQESPNKNVQYYGEAVYLTYILACYRLKKINFMRFCGCVKNVRHHIIPFCLWGERTWNKCITKIKEKV